LPTQNELVNKQGGLNLQGRITMGLPSALPPDEQRCRKGGGGGGRKRKPLASKGSRSFPIPIRAGIKKGNTDGWESGNEPELSEFGGGRASQRKGGSKGFIPEADPTIHLVKAFGIGALIISVRGGGGVSVVGKRSRAGVEGLV